MRKPLFFILGVLLVIPAQAQPKRMTYHDKLLALCEDRAGLKCCRASVHAMREEQARLYDEKRGCPKGLKQVSLRCPSSFSWCSYKNVDTGDPFTYDRLKNAYE